MKRFVVLTVGKTHSGKSTFARHLEEKLTNSLVIDQDNHAEFINTFYKKLLVTQGPNTIKTSITRTILDHAVSQTDLHLILCNSNRGHHRLELLEEFRNYGFTSVGVYFDLPNQVLQERIENSQRSKIIFRSATSFEEVLNRQNAEKVIDPTDKEANYLFIIKKSEEVHSVIQKIVSLAEMEQ